MQNKFAKTAVFLFMIGACLMIASCQTKLSAYEGEKPAIDVKEYFNGPIKAWGIVQGRNGKVMQRFDIDMVGTWQGDTGRLEETFRYYDGKTWQRAWTITKQSDGTFTGEAEDVPGGAKGDTSGNTARWAYQMDLPVGDKTYRVTLDDWMFRMNDGVVVNRSYIKKFGIKVAELTIFMQKQ